MSRDFGCSNVSHLVYGYISRDKSLSRLVYARVLQPKSHVAGCPIGMGYRVRNIQNRHVFASVYGICNGIRDITISSSVSQATTCVGLLEKVQIKLLRSLMYYYSFLLRLSNLVRMNIHSI